MPSQPWWSNLNVNFNKIPDAFNLSGTSKVIVNVLAGVDISTRSVLATMLASKALKGTFTPELMKQDIEQGKMYRELANGHDVSKIFAEPPVVSVTETLLETGHSAPEGAICKSLSFESPFEPLNPDLREPYRANKQNLSARAQYWRHDAQTSRPTICAIHGFLLSGYNINAYLFEMKRFFEQGYDVLFYTLPHHGMRQEEGSWRSGQGYFGHGISWLNETVLHSIFDFRIFLNYLEAQGVAQYGVMGASLGGYTASLLACVEKRLAFVIPNVPVVSMADLFMQWNPANKMLQKSLVLSNTSLYQLRHTLAVHSPLTYKPVIDKDRMLIIAAAADRCAPPNHARLLWDHWQRPEISWIAGNHILHYEKRHYLKDIDALFARIDFLPT